MKGPWCDFLLLVLVEAILQHGRNYCGLWEPTPIIVATTHSIDQSRSDHQPTSEKKKLLTMITGEPLNEWESSHDGFSKFSAR